MPFFYNDAERRINEQFLTKTLDVDCKFDLPKAVADRLKSDDAAHDPEYYNNRPGTVHVSSLYGCQRGNLLKMLGVPEPEPKTDEERKDRERKLGVFKAGNLFEDFIVNALGDKVKLRQREYSYEHKGITLTGRTDGEVEMDGEGKPLRILECKSVNSMAFWHRKKEGTLVQWHNQIQLQTYLWLERQGCGRELDGYMAYISKDDCTIEGAPVKYNVDIINETVIPTLDALANAYEMAKSEQAGLDYDIALKTLPLPPLVTCNLNNKEPYKVNWIGEYCPYHDTICQPGFSVMANDEKNRLNREHKLKGLTA